MTRRVGLKAAATTALLTTASVSAFVVVGPSISPLPVVRSAASVSVLHMADDKIAGSFFNPVPGDPSGSDDEGDAKENKSETPAEAPIENKSTTAAGQGGSDEVDDAFDFDQSMAKLMARRNKKPLAATPSTIGGVPTSKATGFGKQKDSANGPGKPVKKVSPDGSKSFVQLGKPLNDINNPEYDDQGYTLYADEKTGEKKRVFEALVEYPCRFTMKIVGANEGAFAAEMVQVVAESCKVDVKDVENSVKVNGKWTSVTVKAPVKSAEMLYSLYENIDRDPRVKFKF
mmetsp:Transcript_14511/g.31450  ORF Transcript_14511/g.31450 Transcript_14511/m.31450 type:complete len:287 (+) Transcript_14511:118-978(+)